jgi:hypothetical protein
MTSFATSLIRASVALGLLAAGLVLTSCDLASAGNTAILSANSTSPPTVRHRFEYTEDDVTEEGQAEVVSSIQSDDLDAILADNGFSRSDVVSAQVDSVRVERLSTGTLSGADLYLGTDASGPVIARVEFDDPEAETPARDNTSRTVTGAVKSGQKRVFAQFDVEDPSDIPPSGGMVQAEVYYRLEVEGV